VFTGAQNETFYCTTYYLNIKEKGRGQGQSQAEVTSTTTDGVAAVCHGELRPPTRSGREISYCWSQKHRFHTDSRTATVLWHAESLLGKDSEIRNYTTATAK
jgi:hypothetical protein